MTIRRSPANSPQASLLNVSKEAWGEWTRLQTMMVNEYQLNLADLSARKHLMSQCERYFFGDGKTGDLPNYTPKA